MIGDYLKKADKFIKEENFDSADKEVMKALEEEPTNIYALAYRERIDYARRTWAEKKKKEEELRQKKELETPKPLPKFSPPPQQASAPEPPPATPKEQHPTPPAVSSFPSSPPPKVTPPPTPVFRRGASVQEIEKYKKILHDVWHDGVMTTDEAVVLKKVRTELNIQDDMHYLLEKEVKLTCYVEAIRTGWRDGLIFPAESGALDSYRRKFGISIEEHLSVEGKIMFDLHESKSVTTIFLIDDEKVFLDVMKESLNFAGYTVFTSSTPEEALMELKTIIPDLIICDIHFDNSDLDGLFIYDQVRRMPNLVAVPFIFLSGVKDEDVVKAGLGMGVDDFLGKPFNVDTLLAVVEGKLKRYRQLKKTK